MSDYGPHPYTVNIEEATVSNSNYRTTLWTGNHLQMTVMAIAPGDDIGLEMHDDADQFLRVEQGTGRVQMGEEKDKLDYDVEVGHDWVVLVPAGKWHNITNVGQEPLKVYSLYSPPEHPHGTVHETKADDDHHH